MALSVQFVVIEDLRRQQETVCDLHSIYTQSFTLEERRPWPEILLRFVTNRSTPERKTALIAGVLSSPDFGGDIVIGLVTLITTRASPVIYLSHLAVHPDFRQRGIGSQLLRAAIRFGNSCLASLSQVCYGMAWDIERVGAAIEEQERQTRHKREQWYINLGARRTHLHFTQPPLNPESGPIELSILYLPSEGPPQKQPIPSSLVVHTVCVEGCGMSAQDPSYLRALQMAKDLDLKNGVTESSMATLSDVLLASTVSSQSYAFGSGVGPSSSGTPPTSTTSTPASTPRPSSALPTPTHSSASSGPRPVSYLSPSCSCNISVLSTSLPSASPFALLLPGTAYSSRGPPSSPITPLSPLTPSTPLSPRAPHSPSTPKPRPPKGARTVSVDLSHNPKFTRGSPPLPSPVSSYSASSSPFGTLSLGASSSMTLFSTTAAYSPPPSPARGKLVPTVAFLPQPRVAFPPPPRSSLSASGSAIASHASARQSNVHAPALPHIAETPWQQQRPIVHEDTTVTAESRAGGDQQAAGSLNVEGSPQTSASSDSNQAPAAGSPTAPAADGSQTQAQTSSPASPAQAPRNLHHGKSRLNASSSEWSLPSCSLSSSSAHSTPLSTPRHSISISLSHSPSQSHRASVSSHSDSASISLSRESHSTDFLNASSRRAERGLDSADSTNDNEGDKSGQTTTLHVT